MVLKCSVVYFEHLAWCLVDLLIIVFIISKVLVKQK